MKRFKLFVFLTGIATGLSAQFINNGATVVIQNGATLKVETNFINNTGGIVTNNGTLEVTGNFENNDGATFNSAEPSLVKFSGTVASTVKSGTAVFNNVEMAKVSANTTLIDNMSMVGDLNFSGTASKIVLAANDLTLAADSDVLTPGANGYVVTNSTGELVKGITVNGTKVLEVGDTTNYTPVSNAVTGSYNTSTISGRVIDATHPEKPTEADSYISRYWEVNATNITGYNNTMTGTYASSGDAVGTATRIKGASYDGSAWSYANAATDVPNRTVTGSTTSAAVDFTGMNALNKLDITAFLFGAMPDFGTTMNNFLQVYDPPFTPTLLPTSSPYGAPVSNYPNIGNPAGVAGNIVDWVKVEIRSTSNPATILETKSLLLKTNGKIVDINGNIPYFKDQSNSVRIALHHRNHLAVLSTDISGAFEGKDVPYDFSGSLSAAPAESGAPDQLRLKNGKYCLISGDLNSDLSADANDFPSFLTSFNNSDFDIYGVADMNLDGVVDANDFPYFFYSFNLNIYSNILNF
ncbi:MAG: hypothetical protein IPM42_06475 [Saprospiraceae bacterium]|nr:hypothetical protein [Saprospiraceae bacterium]